MSNRSERRYLAASAMNGILANIGGSTYDKDQADLVRMSLGYANAMMLALGPSDEPAPGPAEYMSDKDKEESILESTERRIRALTEKREAERGPNAPKSAHDMPVFPKELHAPFQFDEIALERAVLREKMKILRRIVSSWAVGASADRHQQAMALVRLVVNE